MKKLQNIIFLMAILPFILVTSCKDTDPAPVNDNFNMLSEYMISNNLDLDNVLDGWIVAAPASAAEVDGFLSGYHVFDIRAAADYGAGHVNFAVNTSLGNIVTDAVSVTKPILVVCYTGQTAAHAVVALRLSGHPDAKVLKWGMSGWSSTNSGPWEANSGENGNIAVGNINWTTDATTPLEEFANPTFTTSSTDPATILAERVKVMTDGGFKGVASADVLSSPTNYFINNFWDQVDVDHYGHLVSASRIKPLTLTGGEFNNYNPNETVVSYCWTGQTSSMVTAYLTVMGYDAKSLKFGVNSMIYSELESHQFVTPTTDLPVVN